MRREYALPFAVWCIAAMLAHLLWTTGAEQVARLAGDSRRDGSEADHGHAQSSESSRHSDEFEVSLEPIDEVPADMQLPDPQAVTELDQQPPQQEQKSDPAQPEPPPPEPSVIQIMPLPAPEPNVARIEPPKKDSRIAVEQHVQPNQPDNPNAEFIGNEANHVKEQTVARITAHDRNDKEPTPSGQHTSEEQLPGNADETVIAQGEDVPGDPDQIADPALDKQQPTSAETAPVDKHLSSQPASTDPGDSDKANDKSKADGKKQGRSNDPTPRGDSTKDTQQPATQPTTETTHTQQDGYWLDPTRKKPSPNNTSKAPSNYKPTLQFGLGQESNNGGVRKNLTLNDVVNTVGVDELARQRTAQGERKRSKHRGSWKGSDLKRWKASIENYVSSVKFGNQTALNTARVPFATYLVRIHNRIHPSFADTFLASLDSLPFHHVMNNYKLMTRLEIVLEPNTGRVIRMGVIKTSGVTAFDVGALESVQRASPFGQSPSSIISTDGNVYLHWEFHRNPIYACSTMNARPYMLNTPKAPESPEHIPSVPSEPREQHRPPSRHPGTQSERPQFGKIAPNPIKSGSS